MRIRTGAVALLSAASLLLVGCSGATADPLEGETSASGTTATGEGETQGSGDHAFGEDETLIGGSIFTLQYAWFLGAQEGMEKWAEENPDANVKFQFEDSQQDIQTNIENLENLVSAGAKGIVVFPTDSKAIIPTMVDLHKRTGTQFVVGDYPQQPDNPEDAVWNTFVGHDMVALGESAGQVAVDYFETLGKPDPTVVYITVPTSGEVSADRLKGFSDVVLEAFPEAKIIEEGDTGAGDRNSAQSLMENVLQREATIDLVAGHNDAEVIGAYNAAVGAGRDGEIKFIGIAGDKEVLQYIQDGNEAWIGEVLQDPVVLGYTAMDALWKSMAEGEDLPETYDLPKPEAITPDNIGDYDWQNWTWLG
ncbi:sugar ABC transporter substrate-binding protein [Tessaracoccus sp. OS52]|uniref:sugar ABC transporter substrate-binding protein n=1 Tax=Tessaracoccus sp. OS52 TaxID=2886691 RepID=UPI001D124046|nr:sugar ABC transporter substrate-binding protein [Tessaracoccus sp. OS52]MCC2594269.1 sugar ABC transporter substrate-binding protein [Tessaracoccus sp. OS52]